MGVKIKFLDSGKWRDQMHLPPLIVKAGDVHTVSVRLANVATKSGRAEFYVDPPATPEPEPKKKFSPETMSEPEQSEEAPARRGPGRPKGARNKPKEE